jgi:poly-gamma-glutamate capsule biosynthesis protein CapA/YwtB (metallophosphatase superfamily)
LYGCGDFLNDYEGIGGFEGFRGDMSLMYFAKVEASTGKLLSLHMMPMQVRRFQVNNATKADAAWLRAMLDREVKKLGCRVELEKEARLALLWS